MRSERRYIMLAVAPRRGSHELLLRARHFRGGGGILVVKPMQMEKSMRNIQAELTLN